MNKDDRTDDTKPKSTAIWEMKTAILTAAKGLKKIRNFQQNTQVLEGA